MPQYQYSTRNYRHRCGSCGVEVFTLSPHSETAQTVTRENDPIDGGRVSDTFRWHSGGNRFLGHCRTCERARNRARRIARGPRIPATMTGAPMGRNRRFGVEFECAFPNTTSRDAIRNDFTAAGLYWSFKGDCSIRVPGMTGMEVVSPPLSGDDGEEQVRKATAILRRHGCKVNQSCGTHTHHDANDLTVDQIKRTTRSWFENQHLIDGLVSPSRRRSANPTYCMPLTSEELERVDAASTLESMKRVRITRYRTLNLLSYGIRGTIEIRQHQGTLDAEKVISWVRMGQAIIDTAKVETQAMTRQSSIRDFLHSMGDRLDETARTFLLGRAVEFNAAPIF